MRLFVILALLKKECRQNLQMHLEMPEVQMLELMEASESEAAVTDAEEGA